MVFLAKKLTFILLLVSTLSFGQRAYDNYNIDVSYGLSGVKNPAINSFSHFDIGFRYMFGDAWGLKLDYGMDQFRTQKTPKEMGLNTSRISIQAVSNLTTLIDNRSYFYSKHFNVLAHGGIGYSMQKSVTIPQGGVDEIGHIILGINPQYSITEDFAVGIDASGIINLSQHYWFDGNYTYNDPIYKGTPNSTSTFIYNVSLGLSYTFGGK